MTPTASPETTCSEPDLSFIISLVTEVSINLVSLILWVFILSLCFHPLPPVPHPLMLRCILHVSLGVVWALYTNYVNSLLYF